MTQTCKVCLEQHDEEMHDATNRVHWWFRAHVTRHLYDVVEDPVPMLREGEALGEARLHAA